jgi:Domain of unknown function (DUF4417)
MVRSETRANRRLAHRTELPMALGCLPCPEYALCGGLKAEAVVFDCGSLCRCSDQEKLMCPHVCPSKPQEYVRRRREIDGFDLETIGNAPYVRTQSLPSVIPWIDSHSCLAGNLDLPFIAVPLRRLFSGRSGRAVVQDRASLAARFAVTVKTAVVVTGVSYEQPIENYWSLARSAGFLDDLATLSPAMVTTPNFSLFSDKPREDNLYNMKRIAICWHELANRGIPTALHLNARTDRDWQRWQDFLIAHPGIGSVAFEFGTGAAPKARARWYLHQLTTLAGAVGRPLQLVVRGGRRLLPELRLSFRQVAFIAPDPLMKARKRRELIPGNDCPLWRKIIYKAGEKVDQLFLQNLAEYTRLVMQ